VRTTLDSQSDTIILTRRQINIESITASESAVKGVHLLTLVVKTSPDMVRKISRQIEKLVEVLKVFVHTSIRSYIRR
jgi:acetolactate synthase-1/3 small subunit